MVHLSKHPQLRKKPDTSGKIIHHESDECNHKNGFLPENETDPFFSLESISCTAKKFPAAQAAGNVGNYSSFLASAMIFAWFAFGTSS
jgi:hypothetical protein